MPSLWRGLRMLAILGSISCRRLRLRPPSARPRSPQRLSPGPDGSATPRAWPLGAPDRGAERCRRVLLRPPSARRRSPRRRGRNPGTRPTHRFGIRVLSVPDPNSAVGSSRRDPATIITYRDATRPALLFSQQLRLGVRSSAIPHRYCTVFARRYDPWPSRCSSLRQQLRSSRAQASAPRRRALPIPDPHRAIVSARGQPACIAAQCNGSDRTLLQPPSLGFAS